MPRLQAIDPAVATGKSKELLGSVQKKLGMTPNIMRTLAHSPAGLQTYLGMSGALGSGMLSPKLREQIALTVSEVNGCNYCLAAHTAIGKMVGLSEEQVRDARDASATDSKAEAALRFARQIVDTRGFVSDEQFAAVHEAGYNDAEIVEIVANVALNLFTNYFNHVVETESDFPAVEPAAHAGA